jgi:D-alanyl-D-alanine carboxypeptidase (penicillin-binding protein 5/6)
VTRYGRLGRRWALFALAAGASASVAGPAQAATTGARLAPRARAAIVVERTTGAVVAGVRTSQRHPIASATKLMTVLLALERTSLDDLLPAVAYDALPAESVIGLKEGERLTARDLLRAILIASANDAAVALAVDISGSRAAFVRAMNERARALGLRNTHFENPVGLDRSGNYSSAADLATLTRHLLRSSFFARTVDLPQATLTSGSRRRVVVNRNTLVRNVPWVEGVKTGHTRAAGYVLVAAGRRDGVSVVSVVLGEPSEPARDAESLALLRYGTSRYRLLSPVRRGQAMARARLRYRGDDTVTLVARHGVRYPVRRGERLRVEMVGAPRELDGPLAANARVGTIVVRSRTGVVARVPLVTAAPVAEASFGTRLSDFLDSGITRLLLVVIVGCSLQLAYLRYRATRRRRTRRAPRHREREAA